MARRWQALGIGHPDGGAMCIEATRAGIAALAQAGIAARPLPCGITVFNQTALDLYMRGVPRTRWPPAARSVTVSPELPNSGPGWNGHLVIDHDEFVCDLSLGAFSRPGRVHTRPTVWAKGTDLVPVDATAGPAWIAYRPDRPVIVMIDPKPRLAAWRQTAAWRQDPPTSVIDELVDALHGRRASPVTPTVLLRDLPGAGPSDGLLSLRHAARSRVPSTDTRSRDRCAPTSSTATTKAPPATARRTAENATCSPTRQTPISWTCSVPTTT
jgi:hypothetical protein